MDIQTMFSKTIDFNKTAFASTMALVSSVQQHGEALMKTTLEQSPWLPESSKRACLFWADACTQNLENMKILVDHSLTGMERLAEMSPAGDDKPQKAAARAQRPAPSPAQPTPANRKKAAQTKKSMAAKTAADEKATLQKKPVEKPASPKEKPAEVKAVQEKPATQQTAVIEAVLDKPKHSFPPSAPSVSEDKKTA